MIMKRDVQHTSPVPALSHFPQSIQQAQSRTCERGCMLLRLIDLGWNQSVPVLYTMRLGRVLFMICTTCHDPTKKERLNS